LFNPFNYLSVSVMMPILSFFYALTHSYGMAIIMLTLVVRLAIFPLFIKQYKTQREMARLQPMIKALQAKYKDKPDPQAMNQEMMAFYGEHKLNPVGGCLPMLIQMPFLIALYSTLIGKTFQGEVNHQGFLFIHDLTAVGFYPRWHAPLTADTGFFYYLTTGQIFWDSLAMVLVFGVTTYLTQKMTMTDPNDPMQKQMLTTMPLMITMMFVMIPLPAGVLLYTLISNFFTMTQYVVMKQLYPTTPEPPTPAGTATIDVKPQPVDPGRGKATKKGS
jgi:YidC/Oxa1 family membrane protein insertase